MVVLDSAISLVDSGSAISLVESAAGFRAWIIKGWVADCDTLVVSFSWCKIIIDNFLVFCHKGRRVYKVSGAKYLGNWKFEIISLGNLNVFGWV